MIYNDVNKNLQNFRKISKKNYNFQKRTDIPLGRGLGSSTAILVAGVAALLELYSGSSEHDAEVINNIAYKVEKKFYKNTKKPKLTKLNDGGVTSIRDKKLRRVVLKVHRADMGTTQAR